MSEVISWPPTDRVTCPTSPLTRTSTMRPTSWLRPLVPVRVPRGAHPHCARECGRAGDRSQIAGSIVAPRSLHRTEFAVIDPLLDGGITDAQLNRSVARAKKLVVRALFARHFRLRHWQPNATVKIPTWSMWRASLTHTSNRSLTGELTWSFVVTSRPGLSR